MGNNSKKRVSSKTKAILSILSRNAENGLISAQKAKEVLGMPIAKLSNRLSSLERGGWLKRIRRGFYFIPPIESKPDLIVTVEDSWILAKLLYSPCYIGGWSAAEYWGLTEQIFKSTFVVTSANIRKRSESIIGVEFHIVKVQKNKIRNLTPVWRGARQVEVSDREKTLADALCNPEWVGGIRHLTDMLKTYGERSDKDFSKLLKYLNEFGKGAPFKRFGYLLEEFFPSEKNAINEAIGHKKTGYVKLDPDVDARGVLNKRWGLWINISLDKLQ
ncbi:MAG: type IV toxin-antitoxin system AbiEi family antitoxin [Candidatus Omnitrophota bacterium]